MQLHLNKKIKKIFGSPHKPANDLHNFQSIAALTGFYTTQIMFHINLNIARPPMLLVRLQC